MGISENIKHYRKKVSLTQKQLAEKTGLSIATIQGYEQNKFTPKIEQLQKIAGILKVPLKELFETEEEGEKIIDLTSLTTADQVFTYITEMFPKMKEQLEQEKIDSKKADEFIYYEGLNKLITNYDKLNDLGKKEALKRIEEMASLPHFSADETTALTNYLNFIKDKNDSYWKKFKKTLQEIEDNQESIEVNAAHERTDIEVTEEMKKHDDTIMDDENF